MRGSKLYHGVAFCKELARHPLGQSNLCEALKRAAGCRQSPASEFDDHAPTKKVGDRPANRFQRNPQGFCNPATGNRTGGLARKRRAGQKGFGSFGVTDQALGGRQYDQHENLILFGPESEMPLNLKVHQQEIISGFLGKNAFPPRKSFESQNQPGTFLTFDVTHFSAPGYCRGLSFFAQLSRNNSLVG